MAVFHWRRAMSFEIFKHYLFQIEEILLLIGCIISLGFYIALTARKKYQELIKSEPKKDKE